MALLGQAWHGDIKLSYATLMVDVDVDAELGGHATIAAELSHCAIMGGVQMSTISPPSAAPTTDAQAGKTADGAIYRFLECTAGHFMTPAVVTVTRRCTMRELEALFEKHDFNSFPVVEDGRLLGIITKLDFLRAFAFTTGQMVPHYDELMRRTVAEMMTEAVLHVEPAAPLTRVLELMVSHKSRSIPVMSPERRRVGMISREDVMRALREATQAWRARRPGSAPA
jgi:CBS domain-containing protein